MYSLPLSALLSFIALVFFHSDIFPFLGKRLTQSTRAFHLVLFINSYDRPLSSVYVTYITYVCNVYTSRVRVSVMSKYKGINRFTSMTLNQVRVNVYPFSVIRIIIFPLFVVAENSLPSLSRHNVHPHKS